jgi:tripartite-type tricarboxylate transporter receptor subunit TctC
MRDPSVIRNLMRNEETMMDWRPRGRLRLTRHLSWRKSDGGKARLLAVINPNHASIAPQVPTIAEAGFPDFTFEAVTGFFGPRDILDEVRGRVAHDVSAALQSPGIKTRLEAIGVSANGGSAFDFAAAIERQRAKVAGIANAIGTKPAQ